MGDSIHVDQNLSAGVETTYLTAEDRSFHSVFAQNGLAVTAGELNLAQAIQRRDNGVLGSIVAKQGWSFRSAITTTPNAISLGRSRALLDDMAIEIASTDPSAVVTVNLPSPPVSGTRVDFVTLEAWNASVGATGTTGTSTDVFTHGGITNATQTNDIKAPELPDVETTRRVQVRWAVRVHPNVNFTLNPSGYSDPAISPQGGTNGPVAGYSFVDMGVTRREYSGLWRAGAHNSTAALALGTTDGFVYSLPMLAVTRRPGVTIVSASDIQDLRVVSNLNLDGVFQLIDPCGIIARALPFRFYSCDGLLEMARVDSATVDPAVTPLYGVMAAGTLQSTIATGVAPLVINSTTQVANLNASLLTGATTGGAAGQIPLLDGGANLAIQGNRLALTNGTPGGANDLLRLLATDGGATLATNAVYTPGAATWAALDNTKNAAALSIDRTTGTIGLRYRGATSSPFAWTDLLTLNGGAATPVSTFNTNLTFASGKQMIYPPNAATTVPSGTTVAPGAVLVSQDNLGTVGWSANLGITGQGAGPNYLAKWRDTTTLTDSIMYEANNTIGVGTGGSGVPSMLTVNGGLTVDFSALASVPDFVGTADTLPTGGLPAQPGIHWTYQAGTVTDDRHRGGTLYAFYVGFFDFVSASSFNASNQPTVYGDFGQGTVPLNYNGTYPYQLAFIYVDATVPSLSSDSATQAIIPNECRSFDLAQGTLYNTPAVPVPSTAVPGTAAYDLSVSYSPGVQIAIRRSNVDLSSLDTTSQVKQTRFPVIFSNGTPTGDPVVWAKAQLVSYLATGMAYGTADFYALTAATSAPSPGSLTANFTDRTTAVSSPTTALSPSTAASGGTIPAGIYTVSYAWVGANGGLTPPQSVAATVTTSGTTSTISTGAAPAFPIGVSSINWYVSTAGGGAATLSLQSTTTVTTSQTFTALVSGAAPSASNTIPTGYAGGYFIAEDEIIGTISGNHGPVVVYHNLMVTPSTVIPLNTILQGRANTFPVLLPDQGEIAFQITAAAASVSTWANLPVGAVYLRVSGSPDAPTVGTPCYVAVPCAVPVAGPTPGKPGAVGTPLVPVIPGTSTIGAPDSRAAALNNAGVNLSPTTAQAAIFSNQVPGAGVSNLKGISFMTNRQVRGVIDKNGNWGIGTNAPRAGLHLGSTTSLQIGSDNTLGANYFLQVRSNTLANPAFYTTGAPASQSLRLMAGDADSQVGNKPIMAWHAATGNVSIGQDTYDIHKLHIQTQNDLDGMSLWGRDWKTGLMMLANQNANGNWNDITQNGDLAIIYRGKYASDGVTGLTIAPWRLTGASTGIRLDANGSVSIPVSLTAGSKAFTVPHPHHDDMVLVHMSVESPEHSINYMAQATTDASGVAHYTIPAYYTDFIDILDAEVIVTPRVSGKPSGPVWGAVDLNDPLTIYGTPNTRFDIQMHAVRLDLPPLVAEQPIDENNKIMADNPNERILAMRAAYAARQG